MLSAKRFEPARVHDRGTAAIRQASLAVRVAPVLHASFLPPLVQVENSSVRARQLAVKYAVPLSFRNKRFRQLSLKLNETSIFQQCDFFPRRNIRRHELSMMLR